MVYRNLMATFILGGLWHGSGWTFIFWGFLHGSALVIHKAWQKLNFKLNTILAWFITFNFINITWVFFRAKEWDDAMRVLGGMFGGSVVLPDKYMSKLLFLSDFGVSFGNWMNNIDGDKSIVWILGTLIFILFFKNSMEMQKTFRFNYKTVIFSVICFVMSILSLNKVSEFLYFNF